jgi:hypothetical protein
MPHEFTIASGNWSVTIAADSEPTSATLNRYMLPWLPRADKPSALSFRVTENEGGFVLYGAEGVISRSLTVEGIVPTLQGFVDADFVHRLDDAVAIHAGAVAWRGSVLLFPGASHSGKSTLVAELLKHGFEYFSDEYALIDANGFAHPYPRALMIRGGNPEARPLLARETGATIGCAGARVAAILALRYTPGADWRVRPLPQAEMLITLLKSTPHDIRRSGRLFAQLAQVTGKAVCFAGIRGDAPTAIGSILKLLAASE